MSDREEIRRLLERFENTGLINRNLEQLKECLSSRILGIGLGEQGFVTSVQDVEDIYTNALKEEDGTEYTLDYGRVEILILEEHFGVVCAEIFIESSRRGEEVNVSRSQFQQSLTVVREDGKWKICGLHATTPTVTEEWMESYPLKFAEKSLRALKEKIGEEVYLAEEQYRKAILADTIAFYIINFSRDCFEKCQLQGDICAYAAPDTPYETFIRDNAPAYVLEADQQIFLEKLSLHNIEEAFRNHSNETVCEYRMRDSDGKYIWTRTIVRLIRDVVTGDKKGIMYVKNIDKKKREEQEIRVKADRDGMTGLLNKAAMDREVGRLLQIDDSIHKGVFLMIDVDDFKDVNDTFGHPAGDQVLIAVADLLKAEFPAPAWIGRLGGDEFGVYLPDREADEETGELIGGFLDKVRHVQVKGLPELSISVSAGGAQDRGTGFAKLYQAADDAMYHAKKNGKNTYYLMYAK